jgi:hypothetical protein
MTDQQFTQLVRSQPDWQNSSTAHIEAANYITTLGRMFGFM